MSGQDERARALRALHDEGEPPLVLVNAWDAVSARVVAAQPGCRAIATASWSVAAAHGYPDGEELPPDLLFSAIGIVADAVDLPVTADLEAGYGMPGESARLAIEAGAVGCNLEDGIGAAGLRPLGEAVDAVREVVAAGDETGVPLVVNARTDAFLAGVDDAFDVAVERGRAYLDGGADCIFVPGVTDAATIRALVDAIGPVSVLATPRSPALDELAALGVRRVSFGPGPLGVAMAALGEAAAGLLAHGAYPAALTYRPPGGEAPQTRDERWQRARTALGVFAEEWELPLRPEDLDEMAYATIRHLNNRRDFGEVDAAVREQIADLGRPPGHGGNGNGHGNGSGNGRH
jgi:2-methylisocitrate lyase-like PEP mutase family enzyme